MKTRNNGFGSRLLMALTFLFLYAPIIILIVFSFNAGNSSSVWKGFSLHWYGELFHNRLIMHSVYITLMVSLLATVIATLAVPNAYKTPSVQPMSSPSPEPASGC